MYIVLDFDSNRTVRNYDDDDDGGDNVVVVIMALINI